MKSVNILFFLFIFQFSNLNAQVQWQRCYGGSESETAYCIQQTNDGGFIIAGDTKSSDGNVTGFHGETDFWVIKTDNYGNIEWQKCLGGSLRDNARYIQQTSDEGFIVTGFTESNDGDVSGNHGSFDFWVAKLDSIGNIEWQKCLGGSAWDESWSIHQTTEGGYIVAGNSQSSDGDVSGHMGGSDFWVVKLNYTGNIEWQKCLGGSLWEWAHSIQQTTDGGYIVTGAGDSVHLQRDFLVIKTDSLGNVEWQKYLGGSSFDWSYKIQQTIDEGYILTGVTESNDGDVSGNHGEGDFWVVKLDSSGILEWQKCLGGSALDWSYNIQQTSDGGFIVAGTSYSNDGDVSGNHGGSGDYWVCRLNSLGEIEQQLCLGGSGEEKAYGVHTTSDGKYIVAGASTSNDGDVSGNHGSRDFWITSFIFDPVGFNENESILFLAYPNPFYDKITIHRINSTDEEYIELINERGYVVSRSIIQSGEKSKIISADHLIPGIYFLHFNGPQDKSTIKLIKY